MKRRIIKVLLAITTPAILVGYSSIVTGETCKTAKASSIPNIEEVKTVTENGLLTWDNTEIYFTRNKDDFNALTPILENRNGKIIIEVIEGTVLDTSGNGTDNCGYYIHYDMDKFSVGDKVQTVFVYNPDTNYTDDILYRIDTLIE